ncbi:hypothetical protein Scep_009582 [Stephania cephalantha]|uniref:Pre-rRNA-processing protein TSR2 homolog n=1 Tax=Stephania cephalantha TaxID=152367 RepID=A0AAP0PGE3_9MAGN
MNSSTFSEGIALTLSQWSALQLAIQNQWGGADSLQKSGQLMAELFSFFSSSRVPLCIDDLENLLYENMVLSFNTDIEDGSIEEVAEGLMIMYEECVQGNYESIEKLRKSRYGVKNLSNRPGISTSAAAIRQRRLRSLVFPFDVMILPLFIYCIE